MRIDEVRAPGDLGGGFFATDSSRQVFAAFATEVTIIRTSSPLLRHLDLEIAKRFTEIAARLGRAPRSAPVHWRFPDHAGDGSVVRDRPADGRTGPNPRTPTPQPRRGRGGRPRWNAHRRGRFQRTTDEGVGRFGDVCSPHQLKHGRITGAHRRAQPRASGLMTAADHRYVPSRVSPIRSGDRGMTRRRPASRASILSAVHRSVRCLRWAMEDTPACARCCRPATGRLLGSAPAAALVHVDQPLIQDDLVRPGRARHRARSVLAPPGAAEVVGTPCSKLQL